MRVFLVLFFSASCASITAASVRVTRVGTSGAQFLKLGVNARAIGMGEAYSAVSDGADAIYWNPTGLGRVEGKSVSIMHAVYLEDIFYDFASYAQRVGELGTFAVGFQYLSAASMNQTDSNSVNIGTFRPYDMAVSIGWAKNLIEITEPALTLGVTGKFIRSKIIETAHSGAVDIGIGWNPIERFWMNIGAQNIGPSIKFVKDGDNLPLNIRVGSSYSLFESLLLAMDLNFPRDNDPNGAIGAEYKQSIARDIWLAGRVGYNSRTLPYVKGLTGISAGAGLMWGSYGIDFAWTPFGNLGSVYRVSLSIKL